MKQMEITKKEIDGNVFYIRPLPAFTAANISGELTATVAPLFGSLGTVIDTLDKDDPFNSEMDMKKAIPAITQAFSGISGNRLERLMKKLLTDNKNISYEDLNTGDMKILDEETANEVFCGNMQDMYILCFEVIRVNFSGFFVKTGAQFGNLIESMKAKMAPPTENTENLT